MLDTIYPLGHNAILHQSTPLALTASNSSYVQALTEGYSWTGTTGQATSINYTMSLSSWTYGSEGTQVTNMGLLNSTQQSAVTQALTLWSNVANVTFNQVSSEPSAQLVFRQGDMPSNYAGWMAPVSLSDRLLYADIILDRDYNPSPAQGTYSFNTVMHEIGHALGLKHPHEDNPTLSSSEDSFDSTVMTYNSTSNILGASHYPYTPMIYDIATVQYLYGANTSYQAGNTTHYFTNGNNVMTTIWDGGGNDIINTVGYTGNVIIDLREGLNYYTLVGSSAAWIAFGANIENALSDSGNDTLNGNSLANNLQGSAGNDTLYGNEGNDTLLGGTGGDYLQGNTGADELSGEDGNDSVYGGKENDNLNGNVGDDYVNGNIGNDTAQGGKGNDTVLGGQDNDIVMGNIGNDELYGNLGTDTLYGGQNEDYLSGDDGNDILLGDKGNDLLNGGAGNDTFIFSLECGSDTIQDFANAGSAVGDIITISSALRANVSDVLTSISYSGNSAIINLGGGNMLTLLSIATGALTAEDFTIV